MLRKALELADCCTHSSEPLGSVRDEQFLD